MSMDMSMSMNTVTTMDMYTATNIPITTSIVMNMNTITDIHIAMRRCVITAMERVRHIHMY
jgi:hypothetical protein